MKIGVAAKKGSEISYRVAKEILGYGYNNLGIEMLVDIDIAKDIDWGNTFSIGVDRVDFLIVVGGDGTLLRVIKKLGSFDTPIIGVKTGRRGFLLDVEPNEALARLRDLIEGRYEVYEYMQLKILAKDGKEIYYALNDVVIASTRDTISKIISLEINIGDDTLYRFDGDGIILATPLGSTAYTFSAGGPVVDAELNAIVVTPLAPLQPYSRPVVLSCSRVLEIVNISESDTALCIVDGETVTRLWPREKIIVSKAEQGVRFVRFKRFKTYRRVQICEF